MVEKERENGWDEFKKLILYRLDENKDSLEKIHNENIRAHDLLKENLVELDKRLIRIETKSKILGSVFGFLGGAIISVLSVLAKIFLGA